MGICTGCNAEVADEQLKDESCPQCTDTAAPTQAAAEKEDEKAPSAADTSTPSIAAE